MCFAYGASYILEYLLCMGLARWWCRASCGHTNFGPLVTFCALAGFVALMPALVMVWTLATRGPTVLLVGFCAIICALFVAVGDVLPLAAARGLCGPPPLNPRWATFSGRVLLYGLSGGIGFGTTMFSSGMLASSNVVLVSAGLGFALVTAAGFFSLLHVCLMDASASLLDAHSQPQPLHAQQGAAAAAVPMAARATLPPGGGAGGGGAVPYAMAAVPYATTAPPAAAGWGGHPPAVPAPQYANWGYPPAAPPQQAWAPQQYANWGPPAPQPAPQQYFYNGGQGEPPHSANPFKQ